MPAKDFIYTSVNDEADLVPLSAWQRTDIDAAVASWRRHMKHAKPMVAVRNMSPAFLELAIELDIRLAEFRDRYGRWHLLMRHCERNGMPQEQRHKSGHRVPVPELQRIDNLARASSEAVAKAIREIQGTKAIRHGDRVLKKKSADLQGRNWFRQLDWLHILYDQDYRERHAPRGRPGAVEQTRRTA